MGVVGFFLRDGFGFVEFSQCRGVILLQRGELPLQFLKARRMCALTFLQFSAQLFAFGLCS